MALDAGLGGEPSPAPSQVVGRAIQDLTAARLGRGFLPLGVLAAVGAVQLALGEERGRGAALLTGALASAPAMLAYGLRGVQLAFGRPHQPWMFLAGAGGLIPLSLGVYTLGWLGLRSAVPWSGFSAAGVASGVLFSLLGIWVLRAWWRLIEVQGLARVMALPAEGEGGWES